MNNDNILSEYQKDALTELMNIGVGRAASMLNQMVDAHIKLMVPYVNLVSFNSLKEEMDKLSSNNLSAVRMIFRESISGNALLIFPPASAIKLVHILTGEDPDTEDINSVMGGTLTEVGNIILNGVMGSLGNILKSHIIFSVPTYLEDKIENMLVLDDSLSNMSILLAKTSFTIEELQINGEIVLIFGVKSFDLLLNAVDEMFSDI